MTFAERIRKLRISRGITQREFGDLCGVSPAAVCKWEIRGNPRFEHIASIASALDMTAHELLAPVDFPLHSPRRRRIGPRPIETIPDRAIMTSDE